MATEVVMPKLGLTMERGTIGSWLKGVGDPVDRGEPLLEVVTDKVTMEVEAQASGVLRRILVPEGEEVEVATPIALIAAPEEDLSAYGAAPESPAAPPRPDPTPAPLPEAAPQSPAARPERVAASGGGPVPPAPEVGGRPHRASPKARRLAAERGIDLTAVTGSGPGGRVVSADVEAHRPAPAAPSPAPPGGESVELTPAQRVAAERLTASYQQAPHIYLEMQVSANWLVMLRRGHQAEGRSISYNDLILKAVAAALVEHPRLNAHFVDGRLQQHASVDLGIATDTGSGLLVPVLRGAQDLDIAQIAAETRRLTEAARQGTIGLDDLQGGGFTVSNLGMFGLSRFTAIINPPQVAILAVGAIEPRVVAVEAEAMAVRPAMSLTLSADHRAVDGAAAARFLQRLRELLESPGSP